MFLFGSLLFNLTLFGGAALGGVYGHWLKRTAPDRLLGYGQAWARLMLRALGAFCSVGFVVRGRENLPPGGVILAAQHQSAFDTLVWLTVLDRPCYILKQELTRLPIFGSLLEPAGQIALDRAGGAASLRHLITQVNAALAAGKQIIIFPEGTRVAPGVRGELQPGIVALARASGVPVVPVSTDSGRYWGRNAFRKRPGIIDITLHPALPRGLGRQEMLAALARIYYATNTK
jgi:1-acyl-sn-glycerol-3-phosphate acyltransferase